eukprot:jgi/Botrbrau1/21673/Bobra.43_1s0070.2
MGARAQKVADDPAFRDIIDLNCWAVVSTSQPQASCAALPRPLTGTSQSTHEADPRGPHMDAQDGACSPLWEPSPEKCNVSGGPETTNRPSPFNSPPRGLKENVNPRARTQATASAVHAHPSSLPPSQAIPPSGKKGVLPSVPPTRGPPANPEGNGRFAVHEHVGVPHHRRMDPAHPTEQAGVTWNRHANNHTKPPCQHPHTDEKPGPALHRSAAGATQSPSGTGPTGPRSATSTPPINGLSPSARVEGTMRVDPHSSNRGPTPTASSDGSGRPRTGPGGSRVHGHVGPRAQGHGYKLKGVAKAPLNSNPGSDATSRGTHYGHPGGVTAAMEDPRNDMCPCDPPRHSHGARPCTAPSPSGRSLPTVPSYGRGGRKEPIVGGGRARGGPQARALTCPVPSGGSSAGRCTPLKKVEAAEPAICTYSNARCDRDADDVGTMRARECEGGLSRTDDRFGSKEVVENLCVRGSAHAASWDEPRGGGSRRAKSRGARERPQTTCGVVWKHNLWEVPPEASLVTGRPGTGGSPTWREDFLRPHRLGWLEREVRAAAVRARRAACEKQREEQAALWVATSKRGDHQQAQVQRGRSDPSVRVPGSSEASHVRSA